MKKNVTSECFTPMENITYRDFRISTYQFDHLQYQKRLADRESVNCDNEYWRAKGSSQNTGLLIYFSNFLHWITLNKNILSSHTLATDAQSAKRQSYRTRDGPALRIPDALLWGAEFNPSIWEWSFLPSSRTCTYTCANTHTSNKKKSINT